MFSNIPLNTTNKYRNASGKLLTQGLFWETTVSGSDKSAVLYTLRDVDKEGFPSLYRLYMEMEDLTEYEFAKKYLDGWDHWQLLCNSTFFVDYITRWRTELELKVKARVLKEVIEDASNKNSRSSHASRLFLLNKGWISEGNRKGRPSKQEIKDQAREIAFNNETIAEDLKRLGIN